MPTSQALQTPARAREGAGVDGITITPRAVVRAAAYALLFVGAMQVMLILARFGENVTTIWVASAVLAWALISTPTREWILVIGFAVVAHVARAVLTGEQAHNEVIYLTANVGGPLVCASLLRWRRIGMAFEDRSSVFWFLLFAGVVAPAFAAATASVGTLVNPRRFEIDDLGVWFLADTLSYVVFMPVLMAVSSGGWRDLWRPGLRARAVVLLTLLVALLVAEWFMPPDLRRSFPILLIPFLIFIVFELGLAGGRAALLISTVGLLVYALFSAESSRRGMSLTEYIVSVQIYLAAVVTCILPLAATLAEKQKLYESVSEALEEAQSAWSGLIAAEAHYRLIADNARDLVMRLDLDGVIIFASPACRLISVNVHDLEGRQLHTLAHPDDGARVRSELDGFIKTNMIDHPRTIRTRLKDADGAFRSFDVVSTLISSREGVADEVIAVLREVAA
jgi:PAS domain S-box-containing protein